MIAWLYNLIVGQCFRHDWEEHSRGPVTDGSRYGSPVVGRYQVMQCSKCGKLNEYQT